MRGEEGFAPDRFPSNQLDDSHHFGGLVPCHLLPGCRGRNWSVDSVLHVLASYRICWGNVNWGIFHTNTKAPGLLFSSNVSKQLIKAKLSRNLNVASECLRPTSFKPFTYSRFHEHRGKCSIVLYCILISVVNISKIGKNVPVSS